MITILYCIPALYNPGGMERILIEKVNEISKRPDFDVHVITTDQNGKQIYFDLSPEVQITHLNLDFNKYFDAMLFSKYYNTKRLLYAYCRKLKDYVKENKVDVVVSLGGKELEFLYKTNLDCRKICELHFSISIRKQFIFARGSSFLHKIMAEIRTYQLIKQTRALDKLVVLTKADEKKLQRSHRNVQQIYNFATIESAEPVFSNSKIMVAVGKLDTQKGFDLLIEACSKITDWNGWQLHIYGQGPDREMLEDLIRTYHLEQYVFLKGVSRNISEIYRNASMLILSSRYEGFPMVMLEAITFGLPVISFDCATGPSEIIEDDDCGMLVKDGDLDGMAGAIESLIRNPQMRHIKAVAAWEKSKMFSKKRLMREWITLFRDIAR